MFTTLFNSIVNGFVALIVAIPVPEWALNVSYQIHPYVAWGLDLIEASQGCAILLSAYTIRFLIRRIPVVG